MDVGQSSQFGGVDHSPHHDSAYEQQRMNALNNEDFPNYYESSSSDDDEIANNAEVTNDEDDDDVQVGMTNNIPQSQNQQEPTYHHVPPPMAENPTSESPIQWHSNNIPYLDSLQGRDDAFVFTREDYDSRLKTWIEPKDLNKDRCYLAKGMLFTSKKTLQRAVKIYCFKDMREFKVDQSNTKV
ncbi:uncharacterized protein LOC132047970 [Lycium ferocissimum]|uniref:uncharacterized protein LOC132047970 n=1 Tax=Lycium ferocissimum TaxID=112874 RepID=UPI002815A50B|nr:uncharacterized protein LOC132047970 [Lycium ferocissimum]